ncbi:MAG: ABC transporter permease [Eubacteriales bacterium]
MKLTKNDFKGTATVYRFTVKQLFKNKANIISAVITMAILVLLIPGINILNSRGQNFGSSISTSETETPETIFFLNQTEYDIDLASAFPFSSVIENSSNPDCGYGEVSVSVYYNDESKSYAIDVTDPSGNGSSVAIAVSDALETARNEKIGAPAVMSHTINHGSISDYTEQDGEFSMGGYYLQLIYTILVMIVSLYAAAYIVQSVVEEKTSKLVETLMISVKPLALILGKILAVMTFVFGLLIANLAAALVGNVISSVFLGGEGLTAMLEGLGITLSDLRLDPVALIAAVISLLLGYMTYSLIAGMSGAGCSEQEDIQSANSASVMIVMLCYAAALILTNFQSPVVKTVISLIPMLSIFCAPVQYMLGGIGLPVLIISWVLQLAVIALLAVLCAKIYEDLIIYRGKKIGFGEMIKMALNKKEGERT